MPGSRSGGKGSCTSDGSSILVVIQSQQVSEKRIKAKGQNIDEDDPAKVT